MENAHFDLMRANLDAMKREHLGRLNAELYRIEPSRYPVPPVPRFSRMRRAYRLIRGYISTLWLALCGRELIEPYED